MNKTIILFFSIIIIFLIWVYDFYSFLNKVPKIENNTNISSDAIVVLTGGSGRIQEGISLLNEGLSRKLFISGVNPNFKIEDIYKKSNPDNTIILGREALNTSGNAIEISKWVKEENIINIRLVTSSYHMPRSLLEISYVLPQLEIIPHPVLPTSIKTTSESGELSLLILVEEYFKFLVSRIKYYKLFFNK